MRCSCASQNLICSCHDQLETMHVHKNYTHSSSVIIVIAIIISMMTVTMIIKKNR